MTSAYSISTASRKVAGRPASVRHRLGKAWRGYWQRRAKRVTCELLHSLDDRSLRDIGVGRDEISSLVFGRPGIARGAITRPGATVRSTIDQHNGRRCEEGSGLPRSIRVVGAQEKGRRFAGDKTPTNSINGPDHPSLPPECLICKADDQTIRIGRR